MSEQEGALHKDNQPPYIIFVVVFLFFLTGLGGFLICHLLKQKGYRCRMEDDPEDEDQLEQQDDDEENQDTVEQILKCIIENEANMEAFNEMLGNRSVCVRHDSRLRKESIGGVPLHMHTVHSGSDLHNTCHLCAQSQSRRGQRRASRTSRLRVRPGEQTVLSVGRFRVTHTDKKNLESSSRVPDVLVGSGEHLDQSQDSDERRDAGYNIRNMFKDVRPSSGSTNAMASSAGKRRRSLTLFGLRRGSDPTGIKVVSAGREGAKFIPQPVVFEEPHNESGGSASNRKEMKMSISDASAIKSQGTISVAVESLMQGTKDATAAITPAPNLHQMSLTSSPKPSESVEKKQETLLSPGPLQTSTPLSPLPDPPFTAISNVPIDPPSTLTPPDPCTSPVLEHHSFGSLALISLGSSPHLSKRTPTSPLTIAPSPEFSAKDSLKPASNSKASSKEPSGSPLRSLGKSTTSLHSSSQSVSLQDELSCRSFLKTSSQTELEDSTTQQSMEKPDLKNLGILDERSPPSSHLGGRGGSFTVVKARPDGKREFSVVTMVDDQAVASGSEVGPGDDGGAEVNWTQGDEMDVGAVKEPEEVARNEALLG